MLNEYDQNYGNTDNKEQELFDNAINEYVNSKIIDSKGDTAAKDNEFRVYDYTEIDRLREKRQSDFIPTSEDAKQEMFLTPLYAITGFFAAIMIIGPFLVKQGPNKGLIQACIMLTAFCMWIFWFTIYFGQMNPLMGPRLENTTVAWIAYKLGKPLNSSS